MTFQEVPNDGGVVEKEEEILHGERKAETSLQRQMQLAEQLYEREKSSFHQGYEPFNIEEVLKTTEGKNEIMTHWITSRYSKAFGDLMENKAYKTHKRIKGDFNNITLEDMDHFVVMGSLPKE